MILEQEVDIFFKRVIIHEGAEFEEWFAIDWLRAKRVDSIILSTAVAQMT